MMREQYNIAARAAHLFRAVRFRFCILRRRRPLLSLPQSYPPSTIVVVVDGDGPSDASYLVVVVRARGRNTVTSRAYVLESP